MTSVRRSRAFQIDARTRSAVGRRQSRGTPRNVPRRLRGMVGMLRRHDGMTVRADPCAEQHKSAGHPRLARDQRRDAPSARTAPCASRPATTPRSRRASVHRFRVAAVGIESATGPGRGVVAKPSTAWTQRATPPLARPPRAPRPQGCGETVHSVDATCNTPAAPPPEPLAPTRSTARLPRPRTPPLWPLSPLTRTSRARDQPAAALGPHVPRPAISPAPPPSRTSGARSARRRG